MSNGTINSWERRQNESAQAWQAFEAYREGDDKRSQVKVAVALGKSTTLIERWAKAHDWGERVLEYDRWQHSERLKLLVKG